MKCPKCSQIITHLSTQCGFCDYTYSQELYQKLFFYFDLKNETKNLAAAESALLTRIQKITQKVEKYEHILDMELESYAKTIPAGEKIKAPASVYETAGTPPTETEQKVAEKMQSLNQKLHEDAQNRPQEQAGRTAAEEANKQRQAAQKKSAFESKPAFAPQQATRQQQQQAFSSLNSTYEEKPAESFEMVIGEKWMLIIGIITLVFGVGYFLKFSFDQNWIGPAGRVAMSYLLGIGLLAGGNAFVQRKLDVFGLYLIGGGIAVLYFSAFAAFSLYNLFDQIPSFIIMIMITAFAGFLAIFYDVKWLAVLGIAGGFLTPILLSTGKDNLIGLMSYITMLNAGVLGIAFYKKWDLLNTLGFIFTYLLFAGWYGTHYANEKFWPAVLFLNVFFLIYSVAPFAYQFIAKDPGEAKGFTIITLNAFIAFGFNYNMIKAYFESTQWISIITIFYAAIFLAMGSHLFKLGKQFQDAFVLVLAEASLFLIITIPMIFSGHWITFFWMVQAMLLFAMGNQLKRGALYAGSYVLTAISLLKLMFHDYPEVFRFNGNNFNILGGFDYRFADRYITIIGVLALLYIIAALARKASTQYITRDNMDSSVIYAIFGLTLFLILNMETGAFFYDYLPAARFAAISVLWALFSVGLMIRGFMRNNVTLRKVSIGLFLFTVLKVFLYDMAEMQTEYRIISFVFLGVILISSSFFYHKFKSSIMEVISDDKK